MTGTTGTPRRRRGLLAAGWIFVGIAVLLVVMAALAVLGARGSKDSYGLPWAVVVMLALAAGSAAFGRRLHRESTRPLSRHRAGPVVMAAVYHPAPGRPLGAMLGLGVRHVLWVQAHPRLVRERFPEYFVQGNYAFTSARDAGYVQNGLVYIGTRRPRALTGTLTAALPGKRLPR